MNLKPSTVAGIAEDLTDKSRIHLPWHGVVDVGEAIEVQPQRDRKGPDPVMQEIEQQLKSMLAALAAESRVAEPVLAG